MSTHEQQAKNALGDLNKEIQDTQERLTELQTKKTQLEDRHAGIYPDGPENEIEQVERELMQTSTRIKSTQKHLQKLQQKTPELQQAITKAKEKDHREALQAEAREYSEIAEQLNAVIAENLPLFERAAELGGIKDKIRRFDNSADLFQGFGLKFTAPDVRKKTVKDFIEYLSKGGSNQLFTETDHFTKAKDAA